MDRAALDHMYPYVVPKSWVDCAGRHRLVGWVISDDVHIALMTTGAAAVTNVRPEDLSSFNLTEAEALEIASQNLAVAFEQELFSFGIATLRDGIAVGCARGNWMAPAGALLLANFHAGLVARFGSTDFAAVAANQECLFAFPLDGPTLQSGSLRAVIDDAYNGHGKPISRDWILLDGSWPRAFPAARAF